jgi:hypothetical protein
LVAAAILTPEPRAGGAEVKRLLGLVAGLVVGVASVTAQAFDHRHGVWDELLKKHVVWINGGTASQVDYAGFQRDSWKLRRYLDALSGVSRAEFNTWTRDQQLAFLINAYNAFTIELVLTRYPNLNSIKDLGWLFKSPWKKEFFTLLGEETHLDHLEHGLIRAPGVYNEPRIHVAVVCAAIGCPALRDEAFESAKLDAQLEDSLHRFLSDRTRNRYDPGSGKLEVSKIFDWYQDDFNKGYNGYYSVRTVFAKYADVLADVPADRRRIRDQQVDIRYLDYDWGLNDVRG